MSKYRNKLQQRKKSLEGLEAIEKNRQLVLVIHYSCESFYNIKGGKTPRVTSIAIRNFATAQTTSFSIHKSAEMKGVAVEEIPGRYDEFEKDMLDEYFAYLPTVPVQTFIHWNMRDINYGFQAIEHRYKVLGGTPTVIADNRKVDFARELITLYGVGYAPHGKQGRLHSILELNSISLRDALTGEEEAQAFEDEEFVRLHQSTLRKVDVMANILERTLGGSLKTQSRWRERYGTHPAAWLEIVREHWVWSATAMVAVVVGLIAHFF